MIATISLERKDNEVAFCCSLSCTNDVCVGVIPNITDENVEEGIRMLLDSIASQNPGLKEIKFGSIEGLDGIKLQ